MKYKFTEDKVILFCKDNYFKLGLKFSKPEIKEEFIKIFSDYSECRGVELFNVFDISSDEPTILYLNPAKSLQTPGFYIVEDGKAVLNFYKTEVSDFFKQILNLTHTTLRDAFNAAASIPASTIILNIQSNTSFTTFLNLDKINEVYPENISFNLISSRKSILKDTKSLPLKDTVSSPINIPSKKSYEFFDSKEFSDYEPRIDQLEFLKNDNFYSLSLFADQIPMGVLNVLGLLSE